MDDNIVRTINSIIIKEINIVIYVLPFVCSESIATPPFCNIFITSSTNLKLVRRRTSNNHSNAKNGLTQQQVFH